MGDTKTKKQKPAKAEGPPKFTTKRIRQRISWRNDDHVRWKNMEAKSIYEPKLEQILYKR